MGLRIETEQFFNLSVDTITLFAGTMIDESFLPGATVDEAVLALQRCKAAEQFGKTKTMLFVSTPTKVVPIKEVDPKAAERAKRYLWSWIKRSSGRAK